MSLNRQPGPMNENALQMLRDNDLKKGAEVRTSDDELLGRALNLHIRREEVNPDLKLYGAYLEVGNLRIGADYFVPVDFVDAYNPQTNVVELTVPMSAVMAETWDREPAFIAGHQGTTEKLAS
jgi:hypothetical protein